MNNFSKEIQKSMIFKIHFMNKKKKVKKVVPDYAKNLPPLQLDSDGFDSD